MPLTLYQVSLLSSEVEVLKVTESLGYGTQKESYIKVTQMLTAQWIAICSSFIIPHVPNIFV